jgi:hypothetical protein
MLALIGNFGMRTPPTHLIAPRHFISQKGAREQALRATLATPQDCRW